MRYLLDTDICILYLARRSVKVLRRLQATPMQEIAVCSVVKAELFYGAWKSANPQQTIARQRQFLDSFVSLPFDDSAAEVYGRERARLAKLGAPIGPNDLLIASIALAHNLILVTHNTSEFNRIAGLQIEDWEL
jgi:tRNA(fMet)-specific endonuclease VapC